MKADLNGALMLARQICNLEAHSGNLRFNFAVRTARPQIAVSLERKHQAAGVLSRPAIIQEDIFMLICRRIAVWFSDWLLSW